MYAPSSTHHYSHRRRCVSLALADAEELHKKIERLRDRCAKLEDGLRTLQAAVTDEPHPLLREDSSSDASPSSSGAPPPDGPLLSREDEEFLDAFGTPAALSQGEQCPNPFVGTLTLGIRGEARFFGQTARSEVRDPTAHAGCRLTLFIYPVSHSCQACPHRACRRLGSTMRC